MGTEKIVQTIQDMKILHSQQQEDIKRMFIIKGLIASAKTALLLELNEFEPTRIDCYAELDRVLYLLVRAGDNGFNAHLKAFDDFYNNLLNINNNHGYSWFIQIIPPDDYQLLKDEAQAVLRHVYEDISAILRKEMVGNIPKDESRKQLANLLKS